MKREIVNRNRGVVSTMVLSLLMTIAVAQVSAAEPKGSLSNQQVRELVANAKTEDDHMKLAHHYAAMAEKHEAEAVEHEALAVEYARHPQLGSSKHPMGPNTAEHCKYFAQHCRESAKEMRAMSAAHEAMAKEAK